MAQTGKVLPSALQEKLLNLCGAPNTDYIWSIKGCMKMVEIACSALTIIVVALCPEHMGIRGWSLFVSITSFIATIALLTLILSGLCNKMLNVPWNCVEACMNGLICLMYFVSTVLLCLLAWRFSRSQIAAPIAASIFAFVCFCVYGSDLYILLFGAATSAARTTSTTTANNQPTSTTLRTTTTATSTTTTTLSTNRINHHRHSAHIAAYP